MRACVLLALAGHFAFTANRVLGTRIGRWALEKLFGLSRHRTMPTFSHWSLVRRARLAGLARRPRPGKGPPPAGKLAYLVDPYANWADPTIGLAAVAVMKHHGYAVFVPARVRPTIPRRLRRARGRSDGGPGGAIASSASRRSSSGVEQRHGKA